MATWSVAHGRDVTAPRSMAYAVTPVDRVATHVVVPRPVEELLAEDRERAARGDPRFRVGDVHVVGLELGSTGTWDAVPGGSIWRLRLLAPGALWTSIVLTETDLGPGMEIHAFAPGAGQIEGAFAPGDVGPTGVLALPAIRGDVAIFELYVPDGSPAGTRLVLHRLIAGYRPIFAEPLPGPDAAGACNVDVNCPQGNGWQADKRSVARILYNGWLCTGSLLNDVPQDCRAYFLTANHCIDKANDAAAAVFYWNYEKPGCNSGTGSLAQNQSGSVIRATRTASDFTLLELNALPDSAWNVYYAGWTNATSAAASAVGIHHPSGDVKKISTENDPLVDGISYGPDHWRNTGWDSGVTEGGSSGSGLWNPSHQIVGQLHGGASACGNPPGSLWDEYGKFDVSWSAGGTPSTQLRDWLDPASTGAVSLAGKESSTCGGPCTAPGAPTLTSATGVCTGVSLQWSPGSGTTNAYNVYRRTGSCGGSFTRIAGPLPATSYTDTTASPGTSYAYHVRGACDPAGSIESAASNCLTATRPTAVSVSFTDTPDPSQTGQSVSFAATVSGGTPPYTYAWSFGDGTPAGSGASPTHVYAAVGSPFTVTLTVTDALGCTGVATGPHTVTLAPGGCSNRTLFADDLESGTGNWILDGGGNPFVLSTGASGSPTRSLDGPDPNTNGGRNRCAYAAMAASLPLPVTPGMLRLSFWSQVALDTDDNGIVEISTNGGATFTKLATVSYPATVATTGSATCPTPTLTAGAPAFAGSVSGATYSADLTAFQGQAVRIRFTSVTGNTRSGSSHWYVDDVRVSEEIGAAPAPVADGGAGALRVSGKILGGGNVTYTLSWGPVAGASRYRVYRSTLANATSPSGRWDAAATAVPPGWTQVGADVPDGPAPSTTDTVPASDSTTHVYLVDPVGQPPCDAENFSQP